ncbi:MAG: hypothetical protein SPI30_08790 [Prevotella sp.]|nr:hypothetical protein [Prevotella sp.]
MKPVEIEFLMKDSLSAGIDRSRASVEKLLGAARQAAVVLSAKMTDQRKVIDGVTADLDRMERKLAGMRPGPGHKELTAEIAACRNALAEESSILDGLKVQHMEAQQGIARLEQEYRKVAASETAAADNAVTLTDRISAQRQVIKQVEADIRQLQNTYENAAPGKAQNEVHADLTAARKALEEEKGILAGLQTEKENTAAATRRLTTRLREMQDALARMRLDGRDNTEEFRNMSAEAARLSDTIGDMRQQTNALAHDDANWQGMMSGLTGVSGAITAATGFMSVFAAENENLMKVQARVQGVMAVTMGLQQLFNTLNEVSAFRVVTLARAKAVLTAATTRLASALGISTAAARVLMGTLTLGLSVAIGAAIAAWNRYSGSQSQAEQASKAAAAAIGEAHARWRDSVASTAAAQLSEYRKLQGAWNALGTDLKDKKKFVEDNSEAFRGLGFEVSNVADAESLLVNRTGAVVQSIMARAKAAAYYAEMEQSAREYIRETLQNRASTAGGGYYVTARTGDRVMSVKGLKPGDYGVKTSTRYTGRGNAIETQEYYLTEQGAAAENARRNAEAIRRLNNNNRLARERMERRNASMQAGLTAALAEEKNALAGSGLKRYGGGKTAGEGHGASSGMREENRRAAELAALQKKNRADEIEAMKDGSEKKRAQLRSSYEEEMKELAVLEAAWRKQQRGHLTEEQADALAAGRQLAEAKKQAGEQDIAGQEAAEQAKKNEAARRAWQDYLAEYGTYEEKRKALLARHMEEYMAASTEGERKILEKRLQEALSGLDSDRFRASIDFADVFGNIDAQSTQALSVLRDKLKEYISRAGKDLKPDDMKALQEAFDKIDLKLKERSPFSALKDDIGRLAAAQEAAVRAQEDLNTVMAGGTVSVEEYDAATGKTVRRLLTQEEAERRLGRAQSARYSLLALTTQSLHAGVEKARELGEMASALTDMLADFGVQANEDISGIIAGYGQVLDGLAEIDLTRPASVVTGLAKTMGGLAKTMAGVLSLGGVDFGGKKSIRRYEEAKAKYEQYMSVLDRVIGKQKELVASMAASDYLNAGNSYETAKKLLAQSEEAARNMGRKYLDSGASKGFLGIGSSSSRGRRQHGDISSAGWEEYRRLHHQREEMERLGLTVQSLGEAASGRMSGLFDMTAEQLQWIMENAPTFWAELHDDTRKYLEQIIACGDEWKEIEETRRESLTRTTFDGFYNSWLEKVRDMKGDVRDVAKMIEDDFRNAILSSMMDKKYRQKMRELYELFAEAMGSDGTVDEAEMAELRRRRDEITEQAIAERKAIDELFGWKPDDDPSVQHGRTGGFTAMSQDQGTKLEGLFVSGQMHWSSMDDRLEDVADKMGTAAGTLKKIEEHTERSSHLLDGIRDELRRFARDGIKVK